jgi:hypothetical protein
VGGLALAVVAFVLPAGLGQPKAEKKEGGPKIVVSAPLGAAPGQKVKLTVRGVQIDAATEVRFHDPKATARLLGKTKVAIAKEMDVNRFGDSQVEVEVQLPPDTPEGAVTFVVVTPGGTTPAHRLLVTHQPVVAEKEPNNGFRQAQPVPLPALVDGVISQPQDVDVYRFEGHAGQRVLCEVFAARHGSPLDSFLTVYDAAGNALAANDDHDGSTDSRVEVTLPRDGFYFVSVLDAHDLGSAAHAYRLSLRLP